MVHTRALRLTSNSFISMLGMGAVSMLITEQRGASKPGPGRLHEELHGVGGRWSWDLRCAGELAWHSAVG